MVNYDEYLYPYWERPKSKRPPGAPLPPPTPPLTKLFNIDSIESPLKALELAKTQPYAFALPRSDDESRIPRTDDDAAPASALVSTNFSNAAEAITFLDSVCGGPNPRFSVSYELLAQDTPRKRSVLDDQAHASERPRPHRRAGLIVMVKHDHGTVRPSGLQVRSHAEGIGPLAAGRQQRGHEPRAARPRQLDSSPREARRRAIITRHDSAVSS